MSARACYSLIALLIVLASGPGARGDVYSFTDESGVVHFTNVPVDPRYAILLASPKERTRSGDPYDPVLLARAGQFERFIAAAATATSIEAHLLRAVIVVESGFNSRAVSKAGAAGLMQLMPETARRYGVRDRFDPAENIRAGARYLKALLERYDNNLQLALAAYNAGEQAVDRCGGCIPRYRETQAYVPRVLSIYHALLARPAAG
jgi:soluble lytic murein transglycosylase-like protein